MRTDLEKPFNLICELYTKSVACNIGTLGQVSDSKLFAVSAIVDSLIGTKFNWFDWFISNVQEAAKDFKYKTGSTTTIVRKWKLKFFGKLSYALKEMFPGRKWPGTVEYKKTSVFNDMSKSRKVIIDKGILQKIVRPAIPITEKRGKKIKRATSPVKRAAPKKKKLKRVASIIKPSEEQVDPLEDTLLRSSEEAGARSPAGEEVDQSIPQTSTTQIPQTTQAPQPQPQKEPTPQLQASETSFLPPRPHPKNSQGIFAHRGAIFDDEEESATSIPLPDIPMLNPDPTAAFTIFEPTQATEQAPTQTIQASTPNSPTDTIDTQATSQMPIQPPPINPADRALCCYKADWDQATEELQRRYPNLQMDEAFRTQATDFLTYITYRVTEYYKIFALRLAFSENTIAVNEAEMLQFIGVDGFNALINDVKYWELLDAAVKRAYPNAELPARKLSAHEQKLTE